MRGAAYADPLVFFLLQMVFDRQDVFVEGLHGESDGCVCFGDDGVGVLGDLCGVLSEGSVGRGHVGLASLEHIQQGLRSLGEPRGTLHSDLCGGQDQVVTEVVHGVLELLRLEGRLLGLRVDGFQGLAEFVIEIRGLGFEDLVVGSHVIDHSFLVLRRQRSGRRRERKD
jgi:hypothetical protein